MGDCVANLYNVPTACENITEQYKQIYREQSDVPGDQYFICDGLGQSNKASNWQIVALMKTLYI